MAASYTELMERLGQFASRFFDGHDPKGHFKVHIEKNQISKRILGFGTLIIWGGTLLVRLGADLLSKEDMKNFLTNDVFILEYLKFSTAGLYQLPVQLFAVCSLFSLWATYNNYILIIHAEAINWSVKIIASFGIAMLLAVVLIGFLIPYTIYTMFVILIAYCCALEVAFSLRNSLKLRAKRFNSDLPPALAMRLTGQWFFVNSIVATALLVLILATPSPRDIMDLQRSQSVSPFFSSVIVWQWLVYTLSFLVVFVSALRSGLYLDYEKYADEIRAFNEKLPPTPPSASPPPVQATDSSAPNIQEARPPLTQMISTITAVLVSSRAMSSTLAAALVFISTNSFSYALASLLFLLFSFCFNDLLDFKSGRDLVGHPTRPLPSGKLSPRVAEISCILFFILGLIAAYFNTGSILMFGGLYLLSIFYSVGLKRLLPLIATPAWCFALTILVLWPSTFSLKHYALVFLFLYSRELLLDLRDVKADNKFSILPSLPSVAGSAIHLVICVIFAAIAIIAGYGDNPIIMASATGMLAIYLGSLLFLKEGELFSSRIANLMRIFMLEIFIL